ncbi:hypothetical protein CSZ94_18365 [Janthinobacterium sp. ROICE36]|uniref:EAL domain-containing protein n=1 Tax=Janthinobacterium sp. ROICE36 TaxID=2048670 RepID=UPI000C7E9BF4|nr:EAL domain-containing protein [Janthinobacterium sp. ROICE36]PLY40927.1 hypothetical protein CSZ94_18365 [Janthinobacterium sp. ROICE36]
MIGKLTVGCKLVLIYLLDLSAVIFISAILINEKYIAIDFSRKEMAGNADIAAIRDALLTRVGKQSNLILDPDLDSYYSMSQVTLRFPALLEVINSTRALCLQTQFLILEGRMDATLRAIKALGFVLSIDDLGTGYSSLNYLCRFPLDKLKIDMSFVQDIHASPQNLTVTKTIIGLGHTLGLTVTVEGVESAADADVLRHAGCDELQSYYFARPMPQAQFMAWLAHSDAPCAA